MEINKRSRSELKGYFQKNDIPTESNFAELIDGMLNQKDDGLARPSGDPLSIEAERDDNGLKKLLNFYGSFGDPGPAWSLCLNPREKPNDPKTAAAGFGIVDGDGNARLFIDRKTGNVGIGTNKPAASLHVFGQSLYIQGGQILAPAQLVLQAGSSNAPGQFGLITHSVQPNGTFAPAERLSIDMVGNVGIGAPRPTAPLDVLGTVRVGLNEGDSGARSISFLRDRDDDANAGKIAFRGFGRPSLSIVGAGRDQKLITLTDAVEVTGRLTPSAGNDKNRGIYFPENPGGGGGDAAWIRYYARTGEECTLELGTSNDPQDHIALMPSGNVGVGIRTPGAPLDVLGLVRLGLDEGGSGKRSISFARDDGDEGNCGRIAYKGFNRQELSIVGAGPPSNRAIVLWDNVTIAGKLTVNGGLTSFVVKNGENEFSYNGDADVILRSKGRPDKQGKFGGRALVQDTGNILAINYAGDFTGGVRIDGKVSTPSSRVFKEDIKELSDREATEILSGLKPVQFRARKDPERSIQLGFIAEEVPEVVANPRRDAIYGAHIVATLTKVVKQHQEEIARLTAKLDHLTARGQAE